MSQINVVLPCVPKYCAITNAVPEDIDVIKAEMEELVDLMAEYDAVRNEIGLNYDKMLIRRDMLVRGLIHAKQRAIRSCLC